MLGRLLDHVVDVVIPESQCGFRKNRSTVDMIFVARLLQEKCREQNQNLYLAFMDLTKAFDTVNRELLWNVLTKAGCPPKFISILKAFHNGMFARVKVGGLLSDPFEVKVGVKQGCVLAPILFNIYLAAVTLLSYNSIRGEDGISFRYRFDGSFLNLRRLQAASKTRTDILTRMQYADDAALASHSPAGLQHLIDSEVSTFNKCGLVVNASKTEILCQLSPTVQLASHPQFHAGIQDLNCVHHFSYLGSIISSSCLLDSEIESRIRLASSAFGRLSNRVFTCRNLTTSTKVAVYKAVCISALLYGCESWTTYRSHIRNLESFHIRCLQRILGLTWADRVPHTTILESTGCLSVECLIISQQLRWIGHVIRMPENRLPRKLFYGELVQGQRTPGGQKKRYRDHLHSILKLCNIPANDLESLAADRSSWRSISRTGVTSFEANRTQARETQRQLRHQRQQQAQDRPSSDLGTICPRCARRCASEFGLRSHMRIHK